MLTRHDLEAVVFDFDGTLVDSRIDFALMRERVLAHMRDSGLDPSPVEHWLILEAMHWARDRFLADPARAERYWREAEEVVWEVERPACEEATPFPGVRAALEEAQGAGLKLGVITRNSHRGVGLVLSRHPLPLSIIVTRDDLREVKPHPRHLWRALDALGVPPARALLVGDHPTDLECGRAAGAHSAGVLSTGRTEEECRRLGAALVYPDVTGVIRHLLDGGRA